MQPNASPRCAGEEQAAARRRIRARQRRELLVEALEAQVLVEPARVLLEQRAREREVALRPLAIAGSARRAASIIARFCTSSCSSHAFGSSSRSARRRVVRQQHFAIEVARIDLHEQLAAAPARRDDALGVDRDDAPDDGLARLQHLGDRRVLGAEADAAREVEVDAGVDAARSRSRARRRRPPAVSDGLVSANSPTSAFACATSASRATARISSSRARSRRRGSRCRRTRARARAASRPQAAADRGTTSIVCCTPRGARRDARAGDALLRERIGASVRRVLGAERCRARPRTVRCPRSTTETSLMPRARSSATRRSAAGLRRERRQHHRHSRRSSTRRDVTSAAERQRRELGDRARALALRTTVPIRRTRRRAPRPSPARAPPPAAASAA